MRRTIDSFICEVCGYNRHAPGMCPYCKIELVSGKDVHEVEFAVAGRTREYIFNQR